MSPLKPCAPDYEKHSELSKQNLCQRGLPCFPRLSGKMSGGISGSFTVIFYTGADSSERDAANSYTQPARWMDGQTDRQSCWIKLSTGAQTPTQHRTREVQLLPYFDRRRGARLSNPSRTRANIERRTIK